MSPVRPLIDFLRSVAVQPGEHEAFRRDPEGYLASHGYEGIHRDDANDAMSLVADTLPPVMAARLVRNDEAPLDLVTGFDLERDLDDMAGDDGDQQAAGSGGGEDGGGFGLAAIDDHELDSLSPRHHEIDDVTLDDLVLDDVAIDDVVLDNAPLDDLDVDAPDTGALPWPEAGPSPAGWSGPDLDIGAF